MIKTLKSELKLRPTYDEMIGMIESQGDVTRPSIESVIDRRATIFRNNQHGSQFDNVDILGLKKQEEDKVRNELRQTQLRQTAMATGSSMGVLSATSSGFNTPLAVELLDGQELSSDEISRIQAEMEAHNQRMKEARERVVSSASSDLVDVHSQSLPAGVPVHSMASDATLSPRELRDGDDTMPDLIPIDGADEESQEEDGGDLMNKVGLVGDFNPDNLLDNQDIKSIGLMFQLFVRGLLSDEMVELTDRLPTEQKKKQYLVSIIEGLKETDEWQQSGFAGKTVKKEAKKFREMRRNMKKTPKTQEGGSSSSSSGGGIGSAIASGAKAVGGAILEAGKEAVKDAVIAGAQNAVLSLL